MRSDANMLKDLLEALINFTAASYSFGFRGVGQYLLVGMATGFVVAAINWRGGLHILKELRDPATMRFVALRFGAGALLWPIFLAFLPLLVPVTAIFLGILLVGMLPDAAALLWRKARG